MDAHDGVVERRVNRHGVGDTVDARAGRPCH